MRREAADVVEHRLHRRAAPDHPGARQFAREIVLDGEQVAAPFGFLAHHFQQLAEPLEIEWLLQIVERTELERLHGGLDGRVPGDEDRAALWLCVGQRAKHLDAVHARHAQVHHGGIGLLLAGEALAFGAGLAGDHPEPLLLREAPDQVEHRWLVVDDQQDRLSTHSHVPSGQLSGFSALPGTRLGRETAPRPH